MLIIDPMHNLYLGTAKRLKNIWLSDDKSLITSTQIQTIQDRVNNINVPADLGRIPRKIETKFSSFTADQYKNWVMVTVYMKKDFIMHRSIFQKLKKKKIPIFFFFFWISRSNLTY